MIQTNKREEKRKSQGISVLWESLRELGILPVNNKVLQPNTSVVQTWEAQDISSLNSRECYSREQ